MFSVTIKCSDQFLAAAFTPDRFDFLCETFFLYVCVVIRIHAVLHTLSSQRRILQRRKFVHSFLFQVRYFQYGNELFRLLQQVPLLYPQK